MNPQDLHNDLAAALVTAPDRDAAIDDFQARMQALIAQTTPTQAGRAEAMALGVAVKGALLRSRTDVGTLDFADYGRFQDTMERLGLAKPGIDFQGAPVAMLTAEGMRQATLLKGYAYALHDGLAWKDHVPRAAPSAKEHEQKALWGEALAQGTSPTGERVWTNGHVAVLWPDDEKLLPTALRGDLQNVPSRNFDRVWPQDIAQRERIEPVAVSGVLNASKASVTDARQVWFSNGASAGAYVDAVLRAYPDAQFHADPLQARRGSIAITVPHRDGQKVVGVCMPTSTGYFMNAMPEGAAQAMDAYWLAQGVDPRAKALERAMQEQVRAFSEVNGYFNTALRSPGSNIVLRGHWQDEPTAHPVLQWDVLSNSALRNIAQHTQVLACGVSTPQEVERIKRLDPKELAERWTQEATLAEIGRDGKSLAMTDGLGRRASLDSIEKVVQYRRERALPEWFGDAALHELRYTHESQDSQAFTPPRERDGPPMAIGTRVRWTANPPNVGCIEGLLTQCDLSQAGNWRLTIATRRFDGEPVHHRMWTNEGSVEEAGWSIERDFRFTELVEPGGDHRLLESAQDLEDIIYGIGIVEPAMAHYADALRTQWTQTRTMDEYKDSIGAALQECYGTSVEESLFNDGLEFQRDLGISPLAMAHVVGARLELTPLQALTMTFDGPQDVAIGLVHAEGTAWSPRVTTSQGVGQPESTWNLGPR